MSEEEKKAIEEIQKYNMYEEEAKYLKIILNLIENQQKEIEEEKEKNKELENAGLTIMYMNGFYAGEEKLKNKIKEKIKEYDGLKIIDKTAWEEQVKPLIELLEEE